MQRQKHQIDVLYVHERVCKCAIDKMSQHPLGFITPISQAWLQVRENP